MTTTLSDIVDLFMTKINDYRLTTIYNTSGSLALSSYAEPWLLNSIVDFTICTPPLVYTATDGINEGYFSEDLTLENKMILAELMVKYWLEKNVQDVLQMNVFVQDHDFKTHSNAQNLKAKQDYYNSKREQIYQMLVDYEYRHNDWANWKNQAWNV